MRGSFAILASLVGAVGQAGAACPTDICGDFSVAKTVTDAGSDNWSQCCEPGLNEDAQLKYPDSDPEACAAAMAAFADPAALALASAEGDKMVSMFKKSQRGDSDPADCKKCETDTCEACNAEAEVMYPSADYCANFGALEEPCGKYVGVTAPCKGLIVPGVNGPTGRNPNTEHCSLTRLATPYGVDTEMLCKGDMVDGPGDTVFSQPIILFFIICGGSIVIIFTQCAIVGISAALCCKKKALGEEAP